MSSGCYSEQEFFGESGSHWRVIKASAVALPANEGRRLVAVTACLVPAFGLAAQYASDAH
jgi:hypothetical protein